VSIVDAILLLSEIYRAWFRKGQSWFRWLDSIWYKLGVSVPNYSVVLVIFIFSSLFHRTAWWPAFRNV